MIPLGTFSAKVSSLGSNTQVVGNAIAGSSVPEGRVPLSLISLVAIVAIVAAAGASSFLLLRRRKKAGPSPGQQAK